MTEGLTTFDLLAAFALGIALGYVIAALWLNARVERLRHRLWIAESYARAVPPIDLPDHDFASPDPSPGENVPGSLRNVSRNPFARNRAGGERA